MSKTNGNWQNRIVGYGEEAPDQLLANPLNFRIHPKNQQEATEGSLDSLGWIDDVIVNKTTGNMIDGHLRVILALRHDEKSVPVKYVELTEEEERQALLSLDPIAAMAATDKVKLDELIHGIQSDNEQVQKYLADLAMREGINSNYSRSIQAPIYVPTGDKPQIKELYDDTKTRELLLEIEAVDLQEEEKEFLRIAARRHTILNYKRIAEYYAHSEGTIQRLMENSALVIIDFERAIELGYVCLSEEIADQYREEYDD